jgi:transposase
VECKKKAGLKSIQGQGGGAKLKLPLAAQLQLQEELKGKDFWSLPEIVSLLQNKYGVSYCPGHVRRLLQSWGMYHYTPQPRDYRRAEDAKEKLCQRLMAVADVMSLWNCSCKELAFGFADESSPQANSNKARLWSFYRKVRAVNTDKRLRHNTFAFYAIQGMSVVQEIKDSKAATFMDCLQSIRKANPDARYCVVIWDNLPSHCKMEVLLLARKLGIILVNLPAYAPDLNPIERIWKQIKRIISYQGMVENKEKLSGIITASFNELAKSREFAHKWIEDLFIPVFGQSPIPV